MKEKDNRLQQLIASFAKGEAVNNSGKVEDSLFLSLLEEIGRQSVEDFQIREDSSGDGSILVANESSEPYQLPKLNGVHFSQRLNQTMAEKGMDIFWQLDILLAMIRAYLEQNYAENHLWPEVFASRQKAVDFYLTALDEVEREYHESDWRYPSICELRERAGELARICRELYPNAMLGTESCIIADEETPYVVERREYPELDEAFFDEFS